MAIVPKLVVMYVCGFFAGVAPRFWNPAWVTRASPRCFRIRQLDPSRDARVRSNVTSCGGRYRDGLRLPVVVGI